MSEQIPINPNILKWARKRSGYTIEEISKNFQKLMRGKMRIPIQHTNNLKNYPTPTNAR